MDITSNEWRIMEVYKPCSVNVTYVDADCSCIRQHHSSFNGHRININVGGPRPRLIQVSTNIGCFRPSRHIVEETKECDNNDLYITETFAPHIQYMQAKIPGSSPELYLRAGIDPTNSLICLSCRKSFGRNSRELEFHMGIPKEAQPLKWEKID